ncbi:MAG: hypothetical protein N3D84_02915 [Candidatus Woesearchaeota archaeon]|nr:hypothetical protein [Candidatus Woesearchaeota archaeon]
METSEMQYKGIEEKTNKVIEEKVKDSLGNEGVIGIKPIIDHCIFEIYAKNGGPEGTAKVVSFEGGAKERAEQIYHTIKNLIEEKTFEEIIPKIPSFSETYCTSA